MTTPTHLPLLVLLGLFAGCQAAPQAGPAQRQGGDIADARLQRAQAAVARIGRACAGTCFSVRILNSDVMSAYAWPDGRLHFSRGLLDRVDDEELAAAIAHELGHLLRDGHAHVPAALSGWSRQSDEEKDADAIGCELLRLHSVPPQAMIRLLEKMKIHGRLSPETTHAITHRIATLAARLQP